jgi:carbonic anhydrase
VTSNFPRPRLVLFVGILLALPVLGYSFMDRNSDQTNLRKITQAPKSETTPVEEILVDYGSDAGETELMPLTPPVVNSAPAPASPGVSAEQSLKWLTNGNTRYVKKNFRSDGRSASDRKRLVSGQKPHAIVLSCSDSRVPPEMIFDQTLGEIFVIRVAGEALDSSVIASIEYAVEHLGPKLLVVMGHTQCGAIDAALKHKDGGHAGSEALGKLIADIRPRLKAAQTKASPDLEVESTLNADGVARDLVRRSGVIKAKVESGNLVIKPALYRMDSGKVTFF